MRSSPIFWFATGSYAGDLPPPHLALAEPDGLLAAGGDLGVGRLLDAYRRGIFPWYSEGQPILWWSPDPRAVIEPGAVHVSRSLRRTIKRGMFTATCDRDFAAVIAGCAGSRRDGNGTWITDEMRHAYLTLAARGHAHSVECWRDGRLVGGIYGVTIGCVFFGESMFSRATDASKFCLVHLSACLHRWGYRLIDCQVHNRHLASMGAVSIPRDQFIAMLDEWCDQAPDGGAWREADA